MIDFFMLPSCCQWDRRLTDRGQRPGSKSSVSSKMLQDPPPQACKRAAGYLEAPPRRAPRRLSPSPARLVGAAVGPAIARMPEAMDVDKPKDGKDKDGKDKEEAKKEEPAPPPPPLTLREGALQDPESS